MITHRWRYKAIPHPSYVPNTPSPLEFPPNSKKESIDSDSDSDSDSEGIREKPKPPFPKLRVTVAWQLAEGGDHNWSKLAGGVDATKKAVELHHKFASLRNEIDGFYLPSEQMIQKVEKAEKEETSKKATKTMQKVEEAEKEETSKKATKTMQKLEEAARSIQSAYAKSRQISEETEASFQEMTQLRDVIAKCWETLNHIWIPFGPGGDYFIDGLGDHTGLLNVFTQDPGRKGDHYFIGKGWFKDGEPDGCVLILVPNTNIMKMALEYKNGVKQFVYLFSGDGENNMLTMCERFEDGKKVERAEFYEDGKLKRCTIGWNRTNAKEKIISVNMIEFLKDGQIYYVGRALCDTSNREAYNYKYTSDGLQFLYQEDQKILYVKREGQPQQTYSCVSSEKKTSVKMNNMEFRLLKNGKRDILRYTLFGVCLSCEDIKNEQTIYYFPTIPKQVAIPELGVKYDFQIPTHIFGDKRCCMYFKDKHGRIFEKVLNYRKELVELDPATIHQSFLCSQTQPSTLIHPSPPSSSSYTCRTPPDTAARSSYHVSPASPSSSRSG